MEPDREVGRTRPSRADADGGPAGELGDAPAVSRWAYGLGGKRRIAAIVGLFAAGGILLYLTRMNRRILDDMVVNMVDVGEETGELDKMLVKVADTYDNEVDTLVGALMSLLEPILIVGMGATVGFIVISLFLPLLSIMQQIGK